MYNVKIFNVGAERFTSFYDLFFSVLLLPKPKVNPEGEKQRKSNGTFQRKMNEN